MLVTIGRHFISRLLKWRPMGTNEAPRPRTYQAASKIGRHLLNTRDTLRTNSPRSSARPSEARPRRAKRDRRAKRGRRRRRPAPPGAPELREGREEKLEATKLEAIQLPRFSCLGSAGRVRSTYGITTPDDSFDDLLT